MSQPEPTPPEAIALEDFLKDTAASVELRQFLATDTGRKFRGVLAGMDPMRGLCEPRTLRPESVRALAKIEADCAASILSFCRGYGTAKELVESLTKAPAPKPEPQTRKAGRSIPPHTVPVP